MSAKNSSVRILQLTESWGGMEHNNTQLAVRLARRGVDVRITTVGVAAYSQMPPRYRGIFELEELPWNLARLPSFREWYRIMKARPADIAVLPKNWWAKGGLAMIWAAGAVYPRVVVREHVAVPLLPRPESKRGFAGLPPAPRLWWHRHLLHGRLLSAVPKRIICVSQTVRNRLVEQCAFPPQRTVVAHNGVDTSIFKFDDAFRREVREAFGISDETTVFGSVGRIDNASKRHDWSLRAFARLRREDPAMDSHFLLVGEGADRGAMLSLADELGVADHLTIAPFTSEPWRAYSAMDVFLMPSAFEAFGLSLAEAMSCERCVVATLVEGMREILDENDVGFGVSPENEEEFLAAIRDAYELGFDGRREVGRRARESIVRRFDADQQYEKIIAHIFGKPVRTPELTTP